MLSTGVIIEDPEGDSKLLMKVSSPELQKLYLNKVDERTSGEELVLFKNSTNEKEGVIALDDISHDNKEKKKSARKDKEFWTRRSLRKFTLAKCK